MRRLRALVLIAGSLAAATAVSFAYLRPAAQPAAPVRVVAQSDVVARFAVTAQPDGGYYYAWVRGGSSGGHLASR